jgi:hypothetical protein
VTGEKNSRWIDDLRAAPRSLYMLGTFGSALVPLVKVRTLFDETVPGRGRFTPSWNRERGGSGWQRRTHAPVPFVRLQPRAGELLRQCASHLVREGKWDHLVLLGTVAPTLLLPEPNRDDELDASLYVMY